MLIVIKSCLYHQHTMIKRWNLSLKIVHIKSKVSRDFLAFLFLELIPPRPLINSLKWFDKYFLFRGDIHKKGTNTTRHKICLFGPLLALKKIETLGCTVKHTSRASNFFNLKLEYLTISETVLDCYSRALVGLIN